MNLRQTSQHDALHELKLDQRRAIHAGRLERIHNEREREIGFDYDFLAKQVAEKNAREAAEAEQERAYQQRFLDEQKLLGRMDRQESKIRRQIEQENREFHITEQPYSGRREFDLNRKDYIYAQPPVRTSDTDPWLAVSSCQIMEGEDLTGSARQKRQKEQIRKWTTEQTLENRNKKAWEELEQKRWEEIYLENDRVSTEIGNEERLARYNYRRQLDQENAELARQKRLNESNLQTFHYGQDSEEIDHTVNSHLITESRKQAEGVNGQMVTMFYKGMTEEERKAILEARRKQDEEDRHKREEEARLFKESEDERLRIAKEALKKERIENRRKKAEFLQLIEDNKLEAEKQREEERYRNEELYGTNQPTEDFWKGFGKSHR